MTILSSYNSYIYMKTIYFTAYQQKCPAMLVDNIFQLKNEIEFWIKEVLI